MNTLESVIEKATYALQEIKATSLTPGQLESSIQILRETDMPSLIDEFVAALPPEPEDEGGKAIYRKQMRKRADDLNRKIDPLKDALEEIKKLRRTLNLPALDPVISAAQKIVRPLYGLTAAWQN